MFFKCRSFCGNTSPLQVQLILLFKTLGVKLAHWPNDSQIWNWTNWRHQPVLPTSTMSPSLVNSLFQIDSEQWREDTGAGLYHHHPTNTPHPLLSSNSALPFSKITSHYSFRLWCLRFFEGCFPKYLTGRSAWNNWLCALIWLDNMFYIKPFPFKVCLVAASRAPDKWSFNPVPTFSFPLEMEHISRNVFLISLSGEYLPRFFFNCI